MPAALLWSVQILLMSQDSAVRSPSLTDKNPLHFFLPMCFYNLLLIPSLSHILKAACVTVGSVPICFSLRAWGIWEQRLASHNTSRDSPDTENALMKSPLGLTVLLSPWTQLSNSQDTEGGRGLFPERIFLGHGKGMENCLVKQIGKPFCHYWLATN